jgi:hypothetical protein
MGACWGSCWWFPSIETSASPRSAGNFSTANRYNLHVSVNTPNGPRNDDFSLVVGVCCLRARANHVWQRNMGRRMLGHKTGFEVHVVLSRDKWGRKLGNTS